MAKKATSVGDLINNKTTKNITSQKEFSIEDINAYLGYSTTSKLKKERYLQVNPAVEEALNIDKGLIPLGHTIITRGHSDTGKSTLLIEVAKACQQQNILPVFIVTEMKWDFEHLIEMGFECERVVEEYLDEDSGELQNHVTYKGNFLYQDREQLQTIEQVGEYIMKIIEAQQKSIIKQDVMFLWDSAGTLPSNQSWTSNNKSNQWDAGAMKGTFANLVCPKIGMTRKQSFKYFATLFVVNHIWVDPQIGVFMAQPIMRNSGGDALWKQASIQITFGDITKAGTSIVKATSKGKDIVWGKVTKIQIDKQHTDSGITAKGKLIVTKHGFIPNTKEAIDAYKKQHQKSWVKQLGLSSPDEISIVEEEIEED